MINRSQKYNELSAAFFFKNAAEINPHHKNAEWCRHIFHYMSIVGISSTENASKLSTNMPMFGPVVLKI